MSVIRLMLAEDGGLPKVGCKFGFLGVRLRNPAKPSNRFDVTAVTLDDPVKPDKG